MGKKLGSHNKNKKEKVVKHKKEKKGKSHKQHQKQKQNQKQIVNVNVGGGGGVGGGPKTIPIPFQLPSTIYDPSLITPHYGINDRQPVNPLTDAATDLMTPFIQSLISNQAQKVDRIPIKDAVKPVNPVIPEPILAPSIDSPAPINPVVPPITNASPVATAPPVNVAAPILVAIVPIFSIGIVFPNPSGSFIFFGGFVVGTCGFISFCKFFLWSMCLLCMGIWISESIIISGGIGCDWSVGTGITCGGGLGISGFNGFTASLIGILSTFCAWFAIMDCITGVIKSLAASVSGFVGCLSLIP